MKLWPFGKKTETAQATATQPPEPSAMDRLLEKNCSQDEFFLLYIKLLQERLPGHRFEMTGDSAVKITTPQGRDSTTFMDNAWVQYSRDPQTRRDALERFVRTAVSLNEPSAPPSPERIVAMIKDAQYLAVFKDKDPNKVPYSEHLCGDLWIVYAEDLPERIRTVQLRELAEIGVSGSDIRELATQNLRKVMAPTKQHGDGPWYMLTAGGDYTASLLLFDSLWDGLAESVDGDVVAVVPARDVLFFTGSSSVEGLAAIRERSEKVLNSGNYLISGTLLVRREGRWDVFNAN
jgi:uncharacterized protein YtpQ (UPF0354 family)